MQKDPDILLESASLLADYEFLATAIENRNKHIIDTAKAAEGGQFMLSQMESALDLQVSISRAECLYAYQLLTGNLSVAAKIEKIGASYRVKTQKKKLVPPAEGYCPKR